MANKNKKKTKSQIRAERVAAANKARETMIANAIAEYEAKKKAQRKRKRALAAKKHHHKSQPKQTTQVTTTVVQQSSNVQNTAGVNKFFVERTLSCSKKTKVNSIVSFILSLAVILTGFALALIVFLSFVKNVSDEESLSQWQTIIGKLIQDWTVNDWANVYSQWLSVNDKMWFMTLGSVAGVGLGSILSISFSISELVYSNTVKNNLLSTDQGQKAKLGSFKALNVFAILQIIVGVGAILSYAANVIAWYSGYAIFLPIVQISISGVTLAIFLFSMFTLIFGCKQNSIVKRLCSGQMSMLVGAVGNTTVITDETAQIQTQELSEREKIIAKYNALRAETESKKNADIDQLHSRDESWDRIYKAKLTYYEKEDPKRASKLVNTKNKHDEKLAAKQAKIEERTADEIARLNEAEKAELAALDQREKDQLAENDAKIAKEKSIELANKLAQAQEDENNRACKLSKELHDGKGDEIFDSVEFTPASSKAIREAKKESRRLSKLQDRQEDDELARSRRESKLLFTNKQQEKQPTQA